MSDVLTQTAEAADGSETTPVARASRSPRWLRRTAWIVLLAVAGAVLGLAIGTRLDSQATAEASVLLTPMPGNAYTDVSGNLLTDMETESHLPQSDAVLRRVAADGEPAPSADIMRRRLTAAIVPNASIILIRYKAETAAQARAMVARIAEATLVERVERAKAATAARVEVLEAQKQQEARQSDLLSPTSRETSKVLARRAAELNSQLNILQQAAEQKPGRVIKTVNQPDRLVPKLRIVALLGCIGLGVLVGSWVGRASPSSNKVS